MQSFTISIAGETYKVEVSDSCTKIYDSYRLDSNYKKETAIGVISCICKEAFGTRSFSSLISEIKAHNAMYKHGIKIDHTKDVDIEHKQKFIYRLGFMIVNLFLKEN